MTGLAAFNLTRKGFHLHPVLASILDPDPPKLLYALFLFSLIGPTADSLEHTILSSMNDFLSTLNFLFD